MKIRSYLSTTHELRKMSYRILRKMHDLEKPKKRQYIYNRKTLHSNVSYVLLTLNHLIDLMTSALKQVDQKDVYLTSAVFLYFERLQRLRDMIAVNINSTRPLDKTYVSKALNSHTEVFRRLSNVGVKLTITESMGEHWSKTVLAAIAIWGNSL